MVSNIKLPKPENASVDPKTLLLTGDFAGSCLHNICLIGPDTKPIIEESQIDWPAIGKKFGIDFIIHFVHKRQYQEGNYVLQWTFLPDRPNYETGETAEIPFALSGMDALQANMRLFQKEVQEKLDELAKPEGTPAQPANVPDFEGILTKFRTEFTAETAKISELRTEFAAGTAKINGICNAGETHFATLGEQFQNQLGVAERTVATLGKYLSAAKADAEKTTELKTHLTDVKTHADGVKKNLDASAKDAAAALEKTKKSAAEMDRRIKNAETLKTQVEELVAKLRTLIADEKARVAAQQRASSQSAPPPINPVPPKTKPAEKVAPAASTAAATSGSDDTRSIVKLVFLSGFIGIAALLFALFMFGVGFLIYAHMKDASSNRVAEMLIKNQQASVPATVVPTPIVITNTVVIIKDIVTNNTTLTVTAPNVEARPQQQAVVTPYENTEATESNPTWLPISENATGPNSYEDAVYPGKTSVYKVRKGWQVTAYVDLSKVIKDSLGLNPALTTKNVIADCGFMLRLRPAEQRAQPVTFYIVPIQYNNWRN
jgi:hypothetical protein